MKNKVKSADGEDGKDPVAQSIQTNQREREDSNRRAKGLLDDVVQNKEKVLLHDALVGRGSGLPKQY